MIRICIVEADYDLGCCDTDSPLREEHFLSEVGADQRSVFKVQDAVGYLAWGILIAVSCAIIYPVGKLIYAM